MLSGRRIKITSATLMFFGFGLFHGSAFGDVIANQEAAISFAVLLGYLIELGAIQYTVCIRAGWLSEKFWQAANPATLQPRFIGAMVAGMGLFLTLENIEGPLLGLLFGA